MSAETYISVRVLKTHEEIIKVKAITRTDAEQKAASEPGVVTVLDSFYPVKVPQPKG